VDEPKRVRAGRGNTHFAASNGMRDERDTAQVERFDDGGEIISERFEVIAAAPATGAAVEIERLVGRKPY
jgi:hypothetical protein